MNKEDLAEIEQNIQVPIKPKKLSSLSIKPSNRVNINSLMSKVREEERKQKKENLFFFGFISIVILTTGVIASL